MIEIIIAAIAGFLLGGWTVMKMIKSAINCADICSDDRRMVKDILGIPND